ncbi:hypothetical protein [Gordonia sp. NB41Y]|uniref:hypothetical protein n=1 Tax=Gordonia sp. NB41Y TaxID=875808 RepID=UPI0002BF9A76|nr:hypothetical protein [Gordonia sp. NB41Y]EMP13168.1 hypothetical protein ISGA_3476 [Gordonia sp. NB41Y]WLP90718.1 hypothetical protein Q9K23_25085 [Gordonia sp. NB41Y]
MSKFELIAAEGADHDPTWLTELLAGVPIRVLCAGGPTTKPEVVGAYAAAPGSGSEDPGALVGLPAYLRFAADHQ